MNRLVLLGNGFDLAHGLPTSYNDFLLWYFQDFIEKAIPTGRHRDDLLGVEIVYNISSQTNGRYTNKTLINYYYQKGFNILLNKRELMLLGESPGILNPYRFSNISPLLEALLKNCSEKNWVEIENQYYSLLKKLLPLSDSRRVQCLQLNSGLKAIIHHLSRYLRTLDSAPTSSSYRRIFEHPFQPKEFPTGFLESIPDQKIGEICFLNFNYTNTLKSYVNNMSMDMRLTTNHIHGSVTELGNPIIFGFGDEVDQHYSELEDCGENEYLRFIKSFWYLKTSNYYDLLRFVDSDYYQIYIIGHSCGLSDRTMLRMLFKHPKCKSIKIFYFEPESGKDNFTNITNEISRHFSDKEMLREKVVNFEFSEKMPQVK